MLEHSMPNNETRRKFLRKAGLTGGAVTAGCVSRLIKPSQVLSNDYPASIDVAVVSGTTEKTVKHAFELLGGIEKFIHAGDLVLLKPNISFPNPERWGSTTSPAIVSAVARLALQAGARRVIVADNTMQDSALCFEKTGINAEFDGVEKVKLIQLNRESFFSETAVADGKALTSVKIAKLIDRCDVLINLPCAKSHAATDVSFGLKNLMGLIWDRKYFHTGTDLHAGIAELATIIRPHITILDASRALVTAGPTGPGKVQELRTVIAGVDPLAVDAYACTLVPWNNRSISARMVKHLNHASSIGIGEMDLKKLKISKISL